MDTEEATRTCSQCHREVAEVNFALHETHCSRFLCLCPDCKEAVPKDQLDQHREEEHTEVRCSKCNQKMQRCQLMDHESNECVERLQSCEFCELQLPWKELDKHCLACGSRTNLCRDCGRYVTLRDQAKHGSTCSGTENGSAKVTVHCDRCMASFPAAEKDEHETECVPVSRSEDEEDTEKESDFSTPWPFPWLSSTYKSNFLSDRASSNPSGWGSDPYLISTCPHCHLALPLVTLQRHQVKCKTYILLKSSGIP